MSRCGGCTSHGHRLRLGPNTNSHEFTIVTNTVSHCGVDGQQYRISNGCLLHTHDALCLDRSDMLTLPPHRIHFVCPRMGRRSVDESSGGHARPAGQAPPGLNCSVIPGIMRENVWATRRVPPLLSCNGDTGLHLSNIVETPMARQTQRFTL